MTKERQIQRIGEFIQRQLSRQQAHEQPTVIVLRHWYGEHPEQRLDSMKLSEVDKNDLVKTAGDLYAIAEDDAIGLGDGTQRYIILSYSDSCGPLGRCIFEAVVDVSQEQTATIGGR